MLKIKFMQIKNAVLMEVLEQGDEIKRGCREFFKQNDFCLASYYAPEIAEGIVYVRGSSRKMDNIVTCLSLDDEKSATEYIQKATATIKVYNESLKTGKTELKEDDIKITIAE